MRLATALRVFRLLHPYRVKRNWLFFCVFLRGLQQPLFAWAVGAIIDGPIAHQSSMQSIALAVAGLALLAIVMQITLHFRQRLTLELGESVVNDLRRKAFEHLQRMPMSYFYNTKVGRILSHLQGDCNSVRIGVQDVLFVSLVGLGQMLFAGIIMAYYSLTLFAIVIGMTPVFWLVNRVFQTKLSQAYRDVQESFSRVTAWIAESLSGIRVSQAFARNELNCKQFEAMIDNHADKNMHAARISGIFLPLIELNSQLFIAALIAVGGYLATQPDSSTSVGDLIQFFFLANIFFSPVQVLANQYNQALTAIAGAERVFELIDQPPDPIDLSGSLQLPVVRGEVEFREVVFGYSDDKPVLHGVSFIAKPGQTIALIGSSGGGKSTITQLIARNYVAQQGAVYLDGHNIRELTRETLTRNIAIVPQHNYLFTGSIADNIRFACPGLTDDSIWNLLCEMGCHELFEQLPEGIDSQVGTRGSALSSGQKQLICLARALAVRPSILILDEATSSIDVQTEKTLQKAIEYILEDRTAFIVAHRLSTIQHADQILLIDQGRIKQKGTHAELMLSVGPYADMLASQISRVTTY